MGSCARTACLFVLMLAVQPATAQRPADVAQRLAPIDHLDPGDIFFGCEAFEALAAAWTPDQVRALVHDEDPKVRAMAVVVLHAQLGPRAMPVLVEMLEDQGAAPPALELNNGGERSYTERPQTIGRIATSLFAQYLPHALTKAHMGPDRQIGTTQLRAAYADYVRTRANRAHCLVWLRIALKRAGGGTSPTPPERMAKIREVRRELDAVPAPERHWYLLVLANDWELGGRQHLATEAEVIEAAKALGPAAVFDVLRGIGPADKMDRDPALDPDLVSARYSPFTWEAVAGFLLRHGAALIPRDRCDDWLALQRLHEVHRSGGLPGGNYGIVSADWFLVAADLQPERAREHLKAGFAAIPFDGCQHERGRLAIGWFRHLGDEGRRRAVEWFYGEWPQQHFAIELRQPANAPLFWAIVGDARLDELPWGCVPELARSCNAIVAASAPFSDEELRAPRHPLGVSWNGFCRRSATMTAPRLVGLGVTVEEARGQHPQETADLEREIAAMRKKLRELAAQHAK